MTHSKTVTFNIPMRALVTIRSGGPGGAVVARAETDDGSHKYEVAHPVNGRMSCTWWPERVLIEVNPLEDPGDRIASKPKGPENITFGFGDH